MNPALPEASLAPDEQGNASRYHFRESEGASRLVIEGDADRTPVSIIHEGVRFRVVALEQDGTHYHGSTATGLFDYYKLSRLVAQGLMSRWERGFDPDGDTGPLRAAQERRTYQSGTR